MSYAGRKARIFRDEGDIPDVIRRRSEGRLKSYPSTEDARSWVNEREDRRQQILDYINSDIEKCSMGKYVPIEVLINTLLANKNADAARLKNQVEGLQKLLDMYSKLDLTEDQRRALNAMKREMGKAYEDLEGISGDKGKCAAIKREKEGTSCAALNKLGQSDLKKREMGKANEDLESTSGDKGKCSAVKREIEGTSCAELNKLGQSDLKALVIKKDAEIIALKNELEAVKAELAEERRKPKGSKPSEQLEGRIDESCIKEIEGLEVEIQRLRSKGQLSADDEAEIIRKEIEVLKRYCTKLSSIQQENQKLKSQLEQRQSSTTMATSSALTGDNSNEVNSKIAKLNEVIAERDKLKRRIDVLEKELMKYTDLPKDIEDVKRKTEKLQSASATFADKGTEVENAKDVQQEIEMLKKRASQADELQKELENVNKGIERVRRESSAEIEAWKLKHEELANKNGVEVKGMHEEMKCLAKCAQEAQSLRRERDNLKGRLAQLSGLETQFKQLQEKVKYLESIKKEREMYKMRYEELLGLECQCEILKAQVDKFKNMDRDREGLVGQLRECECCIADQEDEIRRLIAHIDRMSEGCNEQQGRMKKKISTMKAELDEKNILISASKERITCVQEQLRNTITGVTCETSCLRNRIADLERELALAKDKLPKSKAGKSRKTTADGNFEADEHFKEMLQQSKHAVKRVSEELEKHYREWDSLKEVSGTNDQDIYEKYTNEKRTNAELLQTIDTLQHKLDNANTMNAKLTNQAQQTFDQLDTENASLRRLSTEVQDFAKKQIENLTNSLSEAHERISRLELEKNELDSALKQYTENLAQPVGGEGTQVSGETDAMINQNKQLLNDKLALENEMDSLRRELEDCKKQLLQNVSGHNQSYMQERLCMQDIIRQLQAQIAAMEARGITTRESGSITDSPTLLAKQVQIQAESQSAAVGIESPHVTQLQQIDATAGRGLTTGEIGSITDSPTLLAKQVQIQAESQGAAVGQLQQINAMEARGLTTGESGTIPDSPTLLEKQVQIQAVSQSVAVGIESPHVTTMESGAITDSPTLLAKQVQIQAESQFQQATGKMETLDSERKHLEPAEGKQVHAATDTQSVAKGVEVIDSSNMTAAEYETKKRRESGVQTEPFEIPKTSASTEIETESVQKMVQAQDDTLSLLEESKEKLKTLEAHNRDLRKSQQISNEEVSSLRREFRESMEGHADEIEMLSKSYEEELRKSNLELERVSVTKKYQEQEIRNLQKRYSDGIAKLQVSHEEVIKEINVEHEKEVDILMSALRASKEAITEHEKRSLSIDDETKKVPLSTQTLENVGIEPASKANVETWTQGDGTCKCGPTLRAIAKKILQGGMEALDFVDLKLLHEKTCEATATLLRTSPIQWGPCTCVSRSNIQLPEDKQILLKKINSLENELLTKQKHTQQKVGALHISVKMERERLQEFKALLDTERNRNNELMCKIGAQSRIVASMQAEREMIQKKSSFNEEKLHSLKLQYEQEKDKKRQLEEDLQREREMHKKDKENLMNLQRNKYSNLRECECSSECRCKNFAHIENPTVDQSPRQSTEISYRAQSSYASHDSKSRQVIMRQCSIKQKGRRRRSSTSPENKIKSPADIEDID